ncbi:MAG: DUF2309 domain-containing protein [Methylomonas sp.]|jgi:uncharacterized protein YbcC (UPF0753/DUF2309 family)
MTSQTLTQDPLHHSDFNLDTCIDRLAVWLPTQGPIKDFIHYNILQAFQHLQFHDALSVAGKLFGASSYMPLANYQRLYNEGRIKTFALNWALEQTGCSEQEIHGIRAKLFEEDKHCHFPPVSLANHGIRNALLTRLEIDLNALVHPTIFRLLSSFLDQGISRWTLAKNGESFWDCILRLSQNSFIPLYPFHEPVVASLLDKSPDVIINFCLKKIVGSEALYEQYLLEILLGHPGWSGMVRIVETTPQSLLARRNISIKELLAVEILCELATITHKKGENFLSIAQLPNLDGIPKLNEDFLRPKIPMVLRVWHEAMEWALHSELLIALKEQAISAPAAPQSKPAHPTIQALFCIDDRECSIRRHLEEVNPDIETFGAAGFFGIDFFYKGLDNANIVAQCPVVITPKHLVRETPIETSANDMAKGIEEFGKMHFSSQSMFRGWLYTQTIGLVYAVKMAWNVFRPTSKLPGIRTLSEVNAHTRLHLLRDNDEPNADGLLVGFSFIEMADRCGGLLRNIGLTKNFAPLIVVVGHGSSSVNNPHFAAYDCGACSGRPGAPNARAFAWIANHPEVRAILRHKGIDIPDTTRFAPALHNTTRDDIMFFDQLENAQNPLAGLETFKESMHLALQRNALERCRWFELGPQSDSLEDAHDHVISRSASIFEPRPEYDHSNNLYCVVGRRALTRNLFIDRRSFLHSYAPATDSSGEILVRIMNAIFPVCGGINLQYFFSKIDNSVYGAGTKLPHNVIGLLGVANGMEGDLRTGLTRQMIEIHEPSRLMIVIEQTTDIIDKAFAAMPGLVDWAENEWVRVVAFSPDMHEQFLYAKTGWKPIELPNLAAPVAESSEQFIGIRDKTIPVHHLKGRQT